MVGLSTSLGLLKARLALEVLPSPASLLAVGSLLIRTPRFSSKRSLQQVCWGLDPHGLRAPRAARRQSTEAQELVRPVLVPQLLLAPGWRSHMAEYRLGEGQRSPVLS